MRVVVAARGRKWIRHRPRYSRRVPRDPERSTWAREWRFPAYGERSLKCRCWSSKRPHRGKPRGEKNCKSTFPNLFYSSFSSVSSDRAFAREIIVRLFERKEFLNSIYRFSERHSETDTIRRVQFTIVNPSRNQDAR